jgi:hypothetical protein
MRGKVTADAYLGWRCVGWRCVGWRCEEVARVGGFAMRDDDWEVTRLASLQPIRAEQIGYWWVCRITLLDENYTIWTLRNRPWGR